MQKKKTKQTGLDNAISHPTTTSLPSTTTQTLDAAGHVDVPLSSASAPPSHAVTVESLPLEDGVLNATTHPTPATATMHVDPANRPAMLSQRRDANGPPTSRSSEPLADADQPKCPRSANNALQEYLSVPSNAQPPAVLCRRCTQESACAHCKYYMQRHLTRPTHDERANNYQCQTHYDNHFS